MFGKMFCYSVGLVGLLTMVVSPAVWGATIPVLQTTVNPDYVSVDGDLKEWTHTPNLVLGATHQVAGTQKIASAQDFSAKIWLKMDKDSLWLAGQIKDDKVRFPVKNQWLNADHVEFWLAFPQARMPVMGFANQFGFHEVPTEQTCVTDEIEDSLGCQKWFQEQTKRRQWLPEMFVHQFVIAPNMISEVWWNQKKGLEKLDLPMIGSADNQEVFKVVPGGYQFEAKISSSLWPATQQWPVQKAQVLVDIVDNDTGSASQEHFMSSSPQRKYGQPATFNPMMVTYKPAEDEEEWEQIEPPVTTELLKNNPLMFVFPSHPTEIMGFINEGIGYQFSPSEPSPAVVHHKISDKPLLIAGDYRAYLVPDKLSVLGFDQKVVSFKAQTKISELKLQGRGMWGEPDYVLSHYSQNHALLALFSLTMMSPYGSGACGGCPYGEVETLAMDRMGKLKALKMQDTTEHSPYISWPKIWVEPDGAAFGFAYTFEEPEEDKPKNVKSLLTWRELELQANKP